MKSSYHNLYKRVITKPTTYQEDIFTLIYKGNLSAVRKTIKNGDTHLYHRDDKGQTPLHWAILYNQIEIAKELIALGASLDVTDNKGNSVKDIINLHCPEIQDSLTVLSITASTREGFVENEQYENQDSSLLGGCIKNNCEIF
jgi:ankyrin repeat protein